ncbi:MAG: hypothetical protein V7740_13860 [Pseudomonas marincola]
MLVHDYFLASPISTIGKPLPGNFQSDKDREYVSRFSAPVRQRTSLIVRALARNLLEEQTGIAADNWEFHVENTGSRIAVSSTDLKLHVSFSHSPNWGAVAISEFPIGIDVEEVKPGRPWADMTAFLDMSKDTPTPNTELEFLHKWTAKEAKFKFQSASSKEHSLVHFNLSDSAVLCVATELTDRSLVRVF